MTSTPVPSDSTLGTHRPTLLTSSSQTTTFSSTFTSTSDTASKPSASPSPSSLSSSSHVSPSDPLSTSHSATSVTAPPSAHPVPSVTVSPSDGPTSHSVPITTQISTTPIATSATAASVTTGPQGVSVTTVESVVTSVSSSSGLGGKVVTQTSVVVNPTLSPNTDSEDGSHSLTKGGIAAVSITVGLLATSMVVWAFIIYRRRKMKQKIERDSTTAAMAAAGIIRALPLDDEDDDEVPSISRWPQSVFEDGTPVTSAIDQDLRGPFNPHLNYPEPPVLGSRSGQSPAPNASYQMVRSPSVPPPVSCLYRERMHTSSSQGHESHSGYEPLWTSGSSHSYSPSIYPLLSGSLQRRDPPKRTSSEENYALPHILTSLAPPQYTSIQRSSPKHDSPISDYTHHNDEEARALSPLDSRLEGRLREGDGSKGSVGLHDNEDYSVRPRLEIRNRTGSQRTFGSESSKTH